MPDNSELQITGPNGETEINLGTIITTSHRPVHLTIALQNVTSRTHTANLHLSNSLAQFLSISSVQDVRDDKSSQRESTLRPPEPRASLSRNLVYDYIKEGSAVLVPGNTRRIYSVTLVNLSTLSTNTKTSASSLETSALQHVEGEILLLDINERKQSKFVKVRATICESWIRPDLDLLDFGQCAVNSWVYRDITVRNLSEIPTRVCFSHSFRPTSEVGNVTELSFSDPESGYELDSKNIRIGQSASRCVRVAFRATAPIQRDYWLGLQNLDNAENFWHLRVIARVGADRIAEKIVLSCGSELDFGDCYANYLTFRDLILQNNYEEYVLLTLQTDRPQQVSFEPLNEWGVEEAAEDVPRARLSRSDIEYDANKAFRDNDLERLSIHRRLPRIQAAAASEKISSSSAIGSIQHFSVGPKVRDERVDTRKVFRKRSKSPESAILRPGQKKALRMWYLPMSNPRSQQRDLRDTAEFDPGSPHDDSFRFSFQLSSGEGRNCMGRSRVCASILRLERNEVHLGNCNVMTRYRTMLSVINCSDLPAAVSVNYTSQCVFADTHEFEVLPRQAYDLGIEFVPRQVNAGYHKEITISNLRNPCASNLVFTLRADCVDDQGISLHALFYKLLAPGPTNEIDFGVTVANHPAIRAVTLRNLTKKILILEFDKCGTVTTYLPSHNTFDAERYESSSTRKIGPVREKCSCQRKVISPSLENIKTVASATHCRDTANALVDLNVATRHPERNSDDLEESPVWHFESSFANLLRYRNGLDDVCDTFSAKISLQPENEAMKAKHLDRQPCWIEFFHSLSEGNASMLDSIPTVFSNFDSELQYTEQQFRPERNLKAALRAGCFRESRTLVLEPSSESVVVLSLKLSAPDVRHKTKIRPIEKFLSVRMIDFDRSRLTDLPETSSKQMHHIAKMFKEGGAIRPRELLLTVQACKSRMTIAPLRQLNFGTVKLGGQKDKAFTIVNLSEAPLLYEIRKSRTGEKDDIRFNLGKGTQGVVRPYFTKVVPFIFAPSHPGRYEETIFVENRLDPGARSRLIVKAQIRS